MIHSQKQPGVWEDTKSIEKALLALHQSKYEQIINQMNKYNLQYNKKSLMKLENCFPLHE